MKNFKSFVAEAGPNLKPKAKGEADFVNAHKVEISDPEDQGTDGSAKVSTKEGSGKRKADKLDNKQAMGEDVDLDEELTSDQIQKHKQLAAKHRTIAKSSGGDKRVAHQRAANLHAGAVKNPWHKKGSSDAHSASKKLGVSEEVEEIDEISLSLAKKAYKKRADKAYDSEDPKHINKQTDQHNRIIKKFGDKGRKAVTSVTKKYDNYSEEVEEIDEELMAYHKTKSSTGYDLYHKDFSSAMQHAYDFAKKKYNLEIDPKEIDNKVALGPKKPSKGKYNSYRLLDKTGKRAIEVQVANLDNKRYELNMYREEFELTEEEILRLDEAETPFTPDKPKKSPSAVAGKYGQGPSTAKHLAKQGMQKTLRQMKKSKNMQEADFTKQQTKMAHTIGKEFEKKGVGDETRGGPYAVASAMVRDKPEAAKKAYKTIQSKMKEETDAELLFKLYNDLNEENQEFFMHQLEEDADSLLEFARMMEEE